MKMKVFFACALGAFVGALVALQINHYFWWIGMLVGFFTGYLSYEFKTIVISIPLAWKATCLETGGIYHKLLTWRPVWKLHFLRLQIWCLGTIMLALSASIFGLWYFPTSLANTIDKTWVGWPWFVCFATALVAGVISIVRSFTVTSRYVWEASHEKTGALKELRKTTLKTLLYTNPIGLIWVTIIFSIILSYGFFVEIICPLWLFVCKLFLLIHSDLRLLCGTDAALGAATGYLLHNPLLGSLFGGLLGLLNYELVSKRLLHLVKTTE